jgi:chromosome segregation ATPase
VDRRLSDNDTADRDLLQKLTALQAQDPAPGDLDEQTATLSTRRAQLPEQRAEITRARLGSAEACRAAKEKLTACQTALDEIDKKIAAVRAEYEARDRALNENSRAQQDALKEAHTHHQTVEERKNPAYLNIGRHLATQGIAPPNAPHLLEDVSRHRIAVEKHSQHKAELAVLSSQIDKQELRKFYFSVFSVLVLLLIILPLVFKSPAKREWLPHETEAILSVNTEQLLKDELRDAGIASRLTNGRRSGPALRATPAAHQ